MTCDEVDELLAAYALEALSPDETAEVRAHLAGCRRHDAELAELQRVVAALPLAVTEREPAPELRARLLDAVEAAPASTDSGDREPTPISSAPRRRSFRPNLTHLAAAAAVLMLAVIGLTAWNLVLQLGDGDETNGTATVVAEFTGEPAAGRVVYVPAEKVALMELNLPPPSGDNVYQAWRIDESGPASLGLVPRDGVVAMQVDLTGVSTIAVTEEPAGGSDQPTSQPIVQADLG